VGESGLEGRPKMEGGDHQRIRGEIDHDIHGKGAIFKDKHLSGEFGLLALLLN